MKKYHIKFSFDCDGEIEICAESEEDAIEQFKYKSFMEVVEESDTFCDADEMCIESVKEIEG